MKGRLVLVTGAGGFIGSHLVEARLERGAKVCSLVANCGAIFHLGALVAIPYSYSAPRSYVTTNIDWTLNILEAATGSISARLRIMRRRRVSWPVGWVACFPSGNERDT
jgi:nucleoside-diphosphate-sugar epimerase